MGLIIDSPLVLPDADATAGFARRLAPLIAAGDVIALSGDLGAGKTTFARALIHSLLEDEDADVPSPTFTLVQTYETRRGLAIWHVDLYRLSGGMDLSELGLDDAFDHALCLIEWPDRLGADMPESRLALHFEHQAEGRMVHLDAPGHWTKRLGHV